MLVEQRQQGVLGNVQQRALAHAVGIVGAWLAIEQADFAEPVRRLHQAQQRFLALLADGTDAHRAFKHRVQATGRIATLEQPLARRQAPQPGHRQQAIL
ncbi:hypothetical protein D3C72_2037120 [compost metagenome]